jgi:pyruvate dehydrogenase E2 component (dihydrolipoamide acetyltransferase)
VPTPKQVQVPDIGDFDEVDVIEVLVSPGDHVNVEDSLITLESDKATMEIPAPFAGTVRDVTVAVGDKVNRGTPILTLDVDDRAGEQASTQAQAPAAEQLSEAPPPPPAEEPVPVAAPERLPGSPAPSRPPVPDLTPTEIAAVTSKAHASPAVRRLARELGVDLAQVKGSGPKGRILKGDVRDLVKKVMSRSATTAALGLAMPEVPSIDFAKYGEVEVRPLSRIRKRAGTNLHRTWISVPHVTQFDEADITELEDFRKAQVDKLTKEGVKLTLLAFLIKACAVALKDYPEFNASLDPSGENLILKRYCHIGIAVDTAEGLVVPVIRNVDKKGLFQLAAELKDRSEKARAHTLTPDDMRGGSFSISSLGGVGGTAFTPIVNAADVAILGVSRAAMKPVYTDGQFVPRLILPLSLSYDHRVIDGAAAARFTTTLRTVLSDIRYMLL